LNDFKIILDSPADKPALGFDRTALALKEIIEVSKPQFVVGIFGTWGSGKTTLMREIERRLDPAKAITIQFSAWRYEKEPNLVIPLLDVVRERLLQWAEQNQPLRESALKTASTIGSAIYSLLAGLSFKVGLPNALEISYKANESLSQARDFAEREKAARVPRSFYHAAFSALGDSFREFLGSGKPDRIVVFVDDLDRCLPQGALEVLEAMKLFFDLEGFIFVVGLDQGVVERSIDIKYRSDALPGTTAQSNAETVQIRGADYIKKIFQVPFSVAPVAITQLEEFLNAVYTQSALPKAQVNDFQVRVAPHIRHIVTDAGVNPREIKRFLNAYTLAIKIKPNLDRNVVLALQTIAFRRDWESVRLAVLSYRGLFTDAVRRRVEENNLGAITGLDPALGDIPDSFFSYVTAPNPGASLLLAQDLDEHIYSGEATRSPLSSIFLDAIRDVAQLSSPLQQLQAAASWDPALLGTYSSAVSNAVSYVQQSTPRLAGIAGEWKNHATVNGVQITPTSERAVQERWIAEEEAFRRRVMNQLMEIYQFGSGTATSN
jgi:hypothetical protein